MRHDSLLLAAGVIAISGFAFVPSTVSGAPKVGEDPTIAARERVDKNAKSAAADDAKQAAKDAAKDEKRERHDLKKMPKVVQEALVEQTKGGSDIDYYRLPGDEKIFGATFKDAKGELIDVRVDRQGKVISHLTSATGAAPIAAPVAAPGQPAPAAQPQPTPTPAANVDPNKGDLTLDQLPAAVKTTMQDVTKGGKDVRFYKAMQGDQPVFNARFLAANGKDMSVRVDNTGKVVSSKEITDDAVTAAAKDPEALGPSGEKRPGGLVHLDELPGPAQATAKKLTAGAREIRFFKTEVGGVPIYDAKYISPDGVDHIARIDATGKVQDQGTIDLTAQKSSVPLDFWNLPDGVRATARKETKNGKDAKYYRALLDGKRVWKIRFKDSDGKNMEIRTDDAGKVISSHELKGDDDDDKDKSSKSSSSSKDKK